jgi:3'-phosphoadenosine 5'-phosphosulfate sulfotransferase (PAPS reductase)/FAD synthetase
MSRVICTLSGGKASAWCADWALKNYPKEDVLLYFNDTKWEHEDLYRFLNDLSAYFDKEIFYDSDGRNPEQLFYKHNAIANNRMPFCSRELKADRLQKFYEDGDTIIFGISSDEAHRAKRITEIYTTIANKRKKWPILRFPLISENVTREQVNNFLIEAGIEQPLLYKLGFTHNNCSGGCVRAGKKHWKLLYEKLPEVYLDRERMEREVSEYLGKRATIFKDESLAEFRGRIERGELSNYYKTDEDEVETECIGICNMQN